MTVFFGVAEEFQASLMESITVSKNVGDILENILVTRGRGDKLPSCCWTSVCKDFQTDIFLTASGLGQ